MQTSSERPDSRIVVPASYSMKVCIRPPLVFVVVAPPGVDPSPEGLMAPGSSAGLFTFDEGIAWPDPSGVVAANAYLKAGWPIALAFEEMGTALACHARLVREQAQ